MTDTQKYILMLVLCFLFLLSVGCKLESVDCRDTTKVIRYKTMIHEGGAITTEPIYEQNCN